MSRTFTKSQAVRERTPCLVGLIGPSASGKTYSALRLATGMVSVTGGKIIFIDTEARRALHYADDFKFQHIQMDPPFSPLDYLEAIKYASSESKDDVIIVDSMSHEHEGQGGVLEMHDEETKRLAKAWKSSEDAVKFAAWVKPKQQRRRLINEILQMGVNGIFCFRAKEKTKPAPRGSREKVITMGWQAIAGEEFVFEMTVNFLLYPASKGVPTWNPDEKGENSMIKLPKQFEGVFPPGEQLNEDAGRRMAEWATGGVEKAPMSESQKLKDTISDIEGAPDKDALQMIMEDVAAEQWAEEELQILRKAAKAALQGFRATA